uniref:Uncharacterized protein n=1 Tax=Bicosoecida sp. CB-2014 TaxID=1486930 RepID=A0A7S1CD19_9STRA
MAFTYAARMPLARDPESGRSRVPSAAEARMQRDSVKGVLRAAFPDTQVQLFSTGLFGTFHCKVLVLRWDDRVRVAVTSANLSEGDWLDTRQVVWAQDFPRRAAGAARGGAPKGTGGAAAGGGDDDFRTQLCRLFSFCRATWPTTGKVPDGASETPVVAAARYAWLDDYDLSGARAKLVVSLPGGYDEHGAGASALAECGLGRLASVVRTAGEWPAAQASAPILVQASSIGNLTPQYVADFAGMCGCARTDGGGLRVTYPTRAQVRARYSEIGFLVLRRKFWDSAEFPKRVFRPAAPNAACRPRSGPYIADHSKVVMRLTTDGGGGDGGGGAGGGGAGAPGPLPAGEQLAAWVYVGSHNLSAAAWGRLVRGGTREWVSNVEAGVVLTTTSPAVRDVWRTRTPMDMAAVRDADYAADYVPYMESALSGGW